MGLHMSVLVVLVNILLCDPNLYDAVIGSLNSIMMKWKMVVSRNSGLHKLLNSDMP